MYLCGLGGNFYSDVWGGYFLHKCFAHLFQGEWCRPIHVVADESKGDPWDLGSSVNWLYTLVRPENQVAMLGF